jgi:Leucine-rich repeat (LRR) protein
MEQINPKSNYLLVIFTFLVWFNNFAQVDLVYTDIKVAIKNPDSVYQLNLSEKNIKRQIKQIERFKNLEYLDLSFCNIDEFPDEITNCVNLKYLNLSSNSIVHLSENISKLKRLENLIIGYNNLETLPSSIGQCTLIKEIDMSGNYQIKYLPNQLRDLDSLEFLTCFVSKDDFINIICHLTSIRELKIYSNSTDLICEIGRMNNLTSFSLHLLHSEFEPFYCSLVDMKNLEVFHVQQLDCCWPYIDVSTELFNSMKDLLPNGCTISGFRKGLEIKSDIKLR